MRKFALALLFFCCGVLFGQASGTGNYAFGTFDSRGFDSVNVGNLNVNFSIPIVSRTGRGMPFNYALHYEGLIWAASGVSGSQTWVPDPAWGFQGQLNGTGLKGYLTHFNSMVPCTNASGYSKTRRMSGFVYHDEFGIQHRFNYTYTAACASGDPSENTYTGDGSSLDNSGYSLNTDEPYQVLTRSGQIITPAQSATGQDPINTVDSNGNTISGDGSGVLTDTLGVAALTISGTNPRYFTYPISHQSTNVSSTNVVLSYQTYTVQTNFQCGGITEYGANSVSLPYRLTFIDGSFYQFGYEPTPGVSGAVTGRLASVTLPTGGTINYSYTAGCGNGINADGTPGSMTRTTSDGTRQYNRSPNNGNSTFTDVIDEKGNDTHYAFSIDANSSEFFETHRQVYQGNTSGSQLLDRYTCYNGASPNCDGGTVALPITQTQVVESFNGGSQTLVTNLYDPNGTLLTDSKLSVFGGGGLTETANSYNSQGLLTDTQQLDPSQTLYAATSYSYDQSPPASTSGVPQHNAATGTRGNLTSVQVWTGDNTNTLNSSMTYYDTGQVATATAQNGGTTTYGYDSTQGFVTSTALPIPSSGVALSTSAQYDVNTAMPLSSTGMNGDSMTVNVYDGLMRPTDATLPSGSHIVVHYDTPNQTNFQQSLDSSRTAIVVTLKDAYGRLSRTEQFNGQATNQWYQVDYCYDATGLLQFQSSPYQSTGFTGTTKHCSGSGTAYQYDALGRVTSTTNDDGTATTVYNSRAVRTTDVNGVSKMTQYDMMGRIGIVCEISSTNYGSQSPSACNEPDMVGTGYVTTYSYNLASHSTTVSQGGQTRTFQTDWAGRPLSTQEPERGATSYSYAFKQYGLQVTRSRPQANQTNSGTLTNTITQYDKLSRVVSVTYDDGRTPGKNFYYDVTPSMFGWPATSNVRGRLAAVHNTASTGAAYSYDVQGNVLHTWECAPSICGGPNQSFRGPLNFSYDQSGALMTAQDNASGNIVYTRSSAEEVTSVINQTFVDAQNPAHLVSNLSASVNGPSSWTFGNGIQAVRSYDSLGRVSGIFDCSGSSQTYCNGGNTVYGNAIIARGAQVSRQCDHAQTVCENYTYDDLNRLTGVSGDNNAYSYGYSYDRWGNRVSAKGASFSFNVSTNQQVNNTYDAAGNQLTDGSHSYTYDADGKILQVDGGTTATYVYNALDQRVRVTTGSSDLEFLYDPFGRRQSTWLVSSNSGIEGRVYWDYGLLAHRAQNGGTYFHHKNYLGTERFRTDVHGISTSGTATDPFGSGQYPASDNGANQDNNQYTSQDHDAESNTSHFLYRQYSEGSGRWLSPDPYNGSYHLGNPQSFNRYSYLKNNPLSGVDPAGMDETNPCDQDTADLDEEGDPGNASCSAGGGGGSPGIGSGGTADPCANDPSCVTVSTEPPGDPDPDPVDPTGGFPNPNQPTPPHTCIATTCGRPDPNPSDGKKAPSNGTMENGVYTLHVTVRGKAAGASAVGATAGFCTTYPTICTIGIDLSAVLRAIPPVAASLLLLNMQGDNAPVSSRWSRFPGCSAQYENDIAICQQRKTSSCWSSAAQRLAECNATGGAVGWPPLRQ